MKIFTILAFACLCFNIHFAVAENEKKAEKSKITEADFAEIFGYLQKNYVDDIKGEEFLFDSISGGVANLDPHSVMFTEKQFRKMTESIHGKFSGLGIQISESDGFIKVIAPIDDTPAYKAGIKAGDFITHIDGQNVYKFSTEEASALMRGKKGTSVKLVVLRLGAAKPLEFTIVRDVIKSQSVSYKYYAGGNLIIRISSFIDSTSNELAKVLLKDLKGKKINSVTLDLRNNPGGLMDQAIAISSMLLPIQSKIVSVKGRNKALFAVPTSSTAENQSQIAILGCQKKGEPGCRNISFTDVDNEISFIAQHSPIISNATPIIVLINQGSASASEILTGALQDNKRAVVIGQKSFGKGSVQTIIPIGDGKNLKGGLKITTAKYYTPNGKSIQALGITPNVTIEAGKLSKPEIASVDDLFNKSEKDLDNHILNDKLNSIAILSKKYDDEFGGEIFDRFKDYELTTAFDIARSAVILAQNSEKK